jgi:hypothetical protein
MSIATFGPQYFTYPIFSSEDGLGQEGAMKRYKSMPTPADVFKRAMMGIPRFLPLTREELTQDDCEDYLNSALAEIEQSTNIDITPVEHTQHVDYTDGLMEERFFGINLNRWPATKVSRVLLKFPHANTIYVPQNADPVAIPPGMSKAYQIYEMPSGWMYLNRNKLNISAAYGSITVRTDQGAAISSGGLFTMLTGFNKGAYQPGMIEVVYTAGFENDKLPSNVWDMIVTLAALRFLQDLVPVFMPYTNVNVSIDGVSQGVGVNLYMALIKRIEFMQQQYDQKKASINQHFGRTIKLAFIGS